MIVDDHSGIREMLRSLLASPGIELSECADGAEALSVYDDFRPDWVFMDNVMKEVDGLSATRSILNAFPDARVPSFVGPAWPFPRWRPPTGFGSLGMESV